MSKRNYKDLLVWRQAIALAPAIYAVVKRLPREENYALGDQLRRAVVSIAANIAEGQARQHPREFLQHLSIAKGSLAELHTLLIISEQLQYIPSSTLLELEAAIADLSRPLHRLCDAISRLPTTNNQPRTTQEARKARISGQ